MGARIEPTIISEAVWPVGAPLVGTQIEPAITSEAVAVGAPLVGARIGHHHPWMSINCGACAIAGHPQGVPLQPYINDFHAYSNHLAIYPTTKTCFFSQLHVVYTFGHARLLCGNEKSIVNVLKIGDLTHG